MDPCHFLLTDISSYEHTGVPFPPLSAMYSKVGSRNTHWMLVVKQVTSMRGIEEMIKQDKATQIYTVYI